MAEEKDSAATKSPDQSRREALVNMGRYAAFVAPAMTVLVRGNPAGARHLQDPYGGGVS